MQCEDCGSKNLRYEGDALLVATPRNLEGTVLILESAPRPIALDDVKVYCDSCGGEQRGVEWDAWRPRHAPAPTKATLVAADDALDMIATQVNQPECPGADFVEFVSQLLPRTGREVVEVNDWP